MNVRQASIHLQPDYFHQQGQRPLPGKLTALENKTDAFSGTPSKSPSSVKFSGVADPGRIRSLLQNFGHGAVYCLKRTGAFFNYLVSQIKTALFLFMGVFAFLPLKNTTRQWVERLAVFPPVKVKDLPFKHADTLQHKIKDESFNLYDTVRGKLAGIEGKFRIDAKTDNIRLRA